MKERSFYRTLAGIILLLFIGFAQQGYAQDGAGDEGPCALTITRSITEAGDINVCYQSTIWVSHISLSCNATDGYVAAGDGGRSDCLTVPCCAPVPSTEASLILTWGGGDNSDCWRTITPTCCTGPDADGDGICDEDDCWPSDGTRSYGPGDSCDDGNSLTYGDHYDNNCNCIGYTGEPCLTDYDGDGVCDEDDCWPRDANRAYGPGDSCDDGNPNTWGDSYNDSCECIGNPGDPCVGGTDTDGDGVCDEDDCWPQDATQSYGPGDTCDDGNPQTVGDHYDGNCNCTGTPAPYNTDTDGDGICDEDDCWPQDPTRAYGPGDYCNDGNTATYNDRYDDNCNCIGEPSPCSTVDPDDGCPLTTDIVDLNCNVVNTPPDPDDGCYLTYDYFDAENCVIVNRVPEVDDGRNGTLDVFNSTTCEIMHEVLPCDDGDATTVGDKYDENCECQGCDPCQLQGEKWILLCELINR